MAALAPIALGAGMAGTAVSTYSNIQAAKAQAKNADYEATSIENNAAFLERQQRRENSLLQGEANATTAASGLDLSSGSPLFMELDRIKQGELDAQSIRQRGQMAATSTRYGGQLIKNRIPGMIAEGLGQGGSILSTFMARR